MPDGSERSIAYASCTLTASKRNYAQVEKEALSLIFSIMKFHQFVMGDISQLSWTTSRSLPYWGQREVLACSDGHCYCPPTVTTSDFNLLDRMAMPMVTADAH